jgi:hypothetical protein
MPTRPVNTYSHLGREGAIGDLAIHGRAGQARAGEDSLEADDSFGVGHGTLFHSLTVIGSP